MKIEPRGKYAGVKVHLEGEECEELLDIYNARNCASDLDKDNLSLRFAIRLGKKINQLLEEEPKLLEDRTDEQIKAALLKEQEESTRKLEKLEKGQKWNG